MLLSNLTAPNKGETFVDRDIRGITDDSRLVKPGYLFIAVTGAQQDGRAFIKSAIERGATAVVMEPTLDPIENFVPPDANVAILTVLDTRYAQSYIAARFYPRQPRMIAAVTGTSGKTSTAQFARELWQLDGRNAASIGTLGLVTAKESRYGSLTTPGALALHQILDEIAGQGVTHLALEASSHGIELHRLDHVKMRVAAFTNLSRDHLDFHADMEAYLAAKTKLFTELMPQGNTAVLNADIPEFEALNRACLAQGHRVISYGAKGRDIKLLAHRPQPQGQDLKLSVCGKVHNILLPIIGEFQIWNSLCALGMAIGSGGDADQTVAAMEKLSGVPGRLQKVGTSAQGGTVFVDYAHKPGALENVLTGLRPHVAAHPGARLHVVFGCGGNRDKGKRPLMGGIAQRLADNVIVTDDNPRREDPATIRQEVLSGCTTSPHLREIGDRAQAIQTAIAALRDGDVLVIAGKGHENGQIIGDQVLPFDDADVARRVLTP